MDSSGKINSLGEQYIGTGNASISSLGSQDVIAPSIQATMLFAIAAVMWTSVVI
jgi:hypothetical protein